MTKRHLLALAGVALVGAACAPAGRADSSGVGLGEQLRLDPAPASVLAVLLPPRNEAAALHRLDALVDPTARTAENLLVVRQGTVLLSTRAPAEPQTQMLDVRPAEPRHATRFQQRRYEERLSDWVRKRDAAVAALRDRQRSGLTDWNNEVHRRLESDSILVGRPSPAGSTAEPAVAAVRSLAASGVVLGQRRVLLDLSGALASEPLPDSGPDLDGLTVVVPNFEGGSAAEDAATARLLRRGAARALVLAPGADDRLAAVVLAGLEGTTARPLVGAVHFALASSALPASSGSELGRLLELLNVTLPMSTATVNGYTDGLGYPVENAQLSVARAQAVRRWLVDHGVDATRLTVSGHGEQDPLAPTGGDDQPASRRAVVVISP